MWAKINYKQWRNGFLYLLLLYSGTTVYSQTQKKEFLTSHQVETIALANLDGGKSPFESVFTEFSLIFSEKVNKNIIEKYAQIFVSAIQKERDLIVQVKKDDSYLIEKLIKELESNNIRLVKKQIIDFKFN